MSIVAHHSEWLSLVDVSGPFLSIGVLSDVMPNGLDKHDPKIGAELRAAHEEWEDPDPNDYEMTDLQQAWGQFVLRRVLEFEDRNLLNDAATLERFTLKKEAHDVEFRPSVVVMDMDEKTPLMLVRWLDRSLHIDGLVPGDTWTASPRERMTEMLREAACPLGLLTDGERWELVSTLEDQVPGYATWLASLWREEPLTLQAFRTLLGSYRFFTADPDETLPRLLARSTEEQSEVTTKLGNQTLEAVEILVRTIDRLDRDRGGEVLAVVPDSELYDSAVTVMMRLIFLFYAEDNELLPVDEPLYLKEYAASTLRERLQAEADQDTEQILELKQDAWARLLATWRVVYAGVEHGDMRVAPYGGSLFDPDRYPFLEGRLPGSSWREDEAVPLPIDNRTVLHLLTALQTLAERGHRRRLSFRSLDVEQIGHVYEGMLDHTAARANGWVVGLSGTGGKEPEVRLDELEELDDEALVEFLEEKTGRGAAVIQRWLNEDPEGDIQGRFPNTWHAAFGGNTDVAQRAARFAKFIRVDSTGTPTVFPPDGIYVSDSAHRGATGTHYTPRSLTEEVVLETLEPLVYRGPSEGQPENEWELRSPQEILELKVLDPALGSGAFLVQACRYLSAKLVESRRVHGEFDRDATGDDLLEARREITAQCLYGVDINPMAVEMAKLSLWLITLAHDKPFSFLDHAIRAGDSLVGLSDLDQLRYWDLSGDGETQELFAGIVRTEVDEALEVRRKLEGFPVTDMTHVELKRRLLDQARAGTKRLRALADLLFAPSFAAAKPKEIKELRDSALLAATHHVDDANRLEQEAKAMLGRVRPFHWPLEFPEVFAQGGFDGIVGNPPFLGGQRVTGSFGSAYREYLVNHSASGVRGSADLVAYFFLRAFELVRDKGNFGFFAVNTIAEGDTRRIGLEQLLERDAVIYAAHPNEPWPNAANVVTSRVQIHKGDWGGPMRIHHRNVPHISAYLSDREEWSPKKLIANANLAFQGNIRVGDGFVLTSEEAEILIAEDPKNADVLFPFLNGRDLNQDPKQRPSRWVINFWDWSKERSQSYPGPFAIVEKHVKPVRQERKLDGTFKKRKPMPELWWIHAEKRPALYHAIGRGHAFEKHPEDWDRDTTLLDRVLVVAQVGKYLSMSLIPNDIIFSNAAYVFPSDSASFFACLISSVHQAWVWKQSSKLKLDLQYHPTNCLGTFPFPEHGLPPSDDHLGKLGEAFHELRREVMHREQLGLTKLYNRVHDPDDGTDGLDRLRELQIEIDLRMIELYDWSDIELDHDFRDVPYLPEGNRHRFAISGEARLEILDRLGRLNKERYDEEVAAGLHDKKTPTKAKRKKRKASKKKGGEDSADTSQASLFGQEREQG